MECAPHSERCHFLSPLVDRLDYLVSTFAIAFLYRLDPAEVFAAFASGGNLEMLPLPQLQDCAASHGLVDAGSLNVCSA